MLDGFFLFSDTLTSNNNPYESFHGNISFTSDHPIICKTGKFIDQWNNSSQSVLGFNTSIFGSLVVYW